MASLVFSQDWADSWKAAINASSAYAQAGQTWEWPMILMLDDGSDKKIGVYVDLYHGECRAARAAEFRDQDRAAYVLSADSQAWRDVLTSKIDVLTALMSGHLSLEKGSVSALASYVVAAHELVECAKTVDTVFPDE